MELSLEKRELGDLHPYAQNSKRHTDESVDFIVASIERYGFNDPIGINEDGLIIEGHGRYQAALKMDMREVPVIVLKGMTEKQERLYRIAHNKVNLSTTFDFERLTEALSELVGEDITFQHLGFSDDVAENLLKTMGADTGVPNIGTEAPALSRTEPFEIVWEDKEQRKQWQDFMAKLKVQFPNMSPAEALDEFIKSCGVMEGRREVDTEGDHETETV